MSRQYRSAIAVDAIIARTFDWVIIMHQDKKLGLALGVLLVGAVAAFFFRNEAAPVTDAPALTDANRLDQQIDEQALTPYRSEDPIEVGLPDPSASDPFASYDRDSGSRFSDDVEGDPLTLSEPIPTMVSSSRSERMRGPEMYRVQPGDTLSGIAQKFLGRSSRYYEIYEANKDVMPSVDRLRVGMTLRIPGATSNDASLNQESVAARRTPLRNDVASLPDSGTMRDTPSVVMSRRPGLSHGASGLDDRSMLLEEDLAGSRPSDPLGPPVRYQRRFPGERGEGSETNVPAVPDVPAVPEIPSVPDHSPVAQRDVVPAEAGGVHRVEEGDSLERIAIQHYGDRKAVRRIYEANRDRIHRPDRLEVGTTLRLPRY